MSTAASPPPTAAAPGPEGLCVRCADEIAAALHVFRDAWIDTADEAVRKKLEKEERVMNGAYTISKEAVWMARVAANDGDSKTALEAVRMAEAARDMALRSRDRAVEACGE